MRIALYPGTFDPITRGHLDVIERASRIVGEVVIAGAENPGKNPAFTSAERTEMVAELVKGIRNVRVISFDGMTVECARTAGARIIIRGIRTLADFDYEFQMALANRMLDDSIETLFLLASPEHSSISSGLIKEAAALGADVSRFVPEIVARKLKAKLGPGKRAQGADG